MDRPIINSIDIADLTNSRTPQGDLSEAFGLSGAYRTDADFEDKVEIVRSNLIQRILRGEHLVVSSSFGKDSSVMCAIALQAMRFVIENHGSAPQMVVITSNTLIEQPIMANYYEAEIEKVKAYAQAYGLPLRVEVAEPNLSENYLVNIIGGRVVATVPGTGSKCSVMMKVNPLTKLKRRLFKTLGATGPIVSLIGKRWTESAHRGQQMIEDGERPDRVTERDGNLNLFPIAHFTDDDVFQFIGYVRSDLIKDCYSDFDALVDVYRGAADGECLVTAYTDGKASTSGCGARTGCWNCLRVQDDKSMKNFLKVPENAYLRPLSAFRDWLGAEHFNMENRNWMSRKLNADGTMTLSPNTYSPQFCEDLLKILLTIQVREERAQAKLELPPRFTLLRESDVIAIDVLWGRYGYHDSLKACSIWRDIYLDGKEYDIPAVTQHYDRKNLLRDRYEVPFVDEHYDSVTSGFRDVNAMTADVEALFVGRQGTLYTDVEVGQEFEVIEESVELFFDMNLEYALKRYGDSDQIAPAAGLHYLMGLGMVQIAKGNHSEYDRMLRLSNQITRIGLRDVLNKPDALKARIQAYFSNVNADTPFTFDHAA